MTLFESTLTLLFLAILLLQISRRVAIPYPTLLAIAGAVVAGLPAAPDIAIEPHLALALFIAPVLFDSAFDFPPRAIRRYWMPLLSLVGVAVLLTTAAVAWVAVAWAGLPPAAAIALGAIVAPPDAAAAAAVLGRFDLPRRTLTILKGESLLNDASALLIFTAAVGVTVEAGGFGALVPELAFAIPGGLLLGLAGGKLFVHLSPRLAGTLGARLMEFVTTFGVWLIAERFHLSAILAVVAFGMTVARYVPERQPPRDRLHAYSVWETMVFLLNVLAFLLMGLQAREIIGRLDPAQLSQALLFAAAVLGIVVAVRFLWVLAYNRTARLYARVRRSSEAPTLAQGILVSWCGMRGLVTLATAQALPASFPGRDLIVLSALGVVLGTLVIQGLTLGPLIRLLRIRPDDSFGTELSQARVALLDAAVASLAGRDDEPARCLRGIYEVERSVAAGGRHPRAVTELDRLRRRTILAKRALLADMRRTGRIDDDVFHALEQELDWAELAASPPDRLELHEG